MRRRRSLWAVEHEYAKSIGWIAGQCYVIDIFLWHMARHGYVLRKASTKLPFEDIEESTRSRIDKMRQASARVLSSAIGGSDA